MRKSSLYQALARATGEPRQRLRQIGFNLIRIVRISPRRERNPKCSPKEGQSRNI